MKILKIKLIFLTLFLCSNLSLAKSNLIVKDSLQDYIKIPLNYITQLYQKSAVKFTTGDYEFSCSQTQIFDEESLVVLSKEKSFPIQEKIPQGNLHQCLILNKKSPQLMGRGTLSVHEIEKQK